MKFSLKLQKYFYITLLTLLNILLSSTFIIYSDKWYIYIFILALGSFINSISVILLLIRKLLAKNNKHLIYRQNPKNYTYIIPCYNENESELQHSLDSLVNQRIIEDDKRSFIIICDGKVKGSDSIISTDNILKNILNIQKQSKKYNYCTADTKTNSIELFRGEYKQVPFILMIKDINYGKRDSITLVRRLCNLYNQSKTEHDMISSELINYFNKYFKKIYKNKVEYLIGIDADTIFEYTCTYELIKKIDYSDDNVKGCVGFVDVIKENKFSLFILYQYAEYVVAQCIRRQAQSKITHKVSCLSGCNQLLKICEETCGDIILNKFNYLPKEDENIFNHIRSYASEDRNHVCLMLSMFPYVQTVQAMGAIAYTHVPFNFNVLLSQRRRWSLGSTTNDMLLIYMPGINFFERVSAFINVFVYSFNPFIVIASVLFLKILFTQPSYLLLFLSTLIMIPLLYVILIPIFIKPMIFKDALYFYLSYIFFLICGMTTSRHNTYKILIYYINHFNFSFITIFT